MVLLTKSHWFICKQIPSRNQITNFTRKINMPSNHVLRFSPQGPQCTPLRKGKYYFHIHLIYKQYFILLKSKYIFNRQLAIQWYKKRDRDQGGKGLEREKSWMEKNAKLDVERSDEEEKEIGRERKWWTEERWLKLGRKKKWRWEGKEKERRL